MGNAICNGPRLEWSSSHCGVHLLSGLVPDFEEAVPGPRRHGHPVISYPQAAHAVVMPGQDPWGQRTVWSAWGPATCLSGTRNPRTQSLPGLGGEERIPTQRAQHRGWAFRTGTAIPLPQTGRPVTLSGQCLDNHQPRLSRGI